MKTLVLSLLIGFLSACSTIPKYSEQLLYSNSIPNVWAMEGRLSATIKGETETANFKLNRQGKHHQLTLSNSLGFGQIQVKQTQQGLLVNGKLIGLSLQQWMTAELGWYFPVEILQNIVFLSSQKLNYENTRGWQVKISKYRVFAGIAYPQIMRLNHSSKHIKIKLRLQQVNRLK